MDSTATTISPSVRGDVWLAEVSNVNGRVSHALRNRTSTGIAQLDDLLASFGTGRVVELSGAMGSGKTSLALRVVLSHLVGDPESSALWIDTTGEFPVERISSALAPYDEQVSSAVLERLQVSFAFDLESTCGILDAIPAALSSGFSTLSYIVIDPITPLLGPSLSGTSTKGHAQMTEFMRQLRSLAQDFSIMGFVINSSTASSPTNPHSAFATANKKPALGPSFPFMTDATLWCAVYDDEENSPVDDARTHLVEVFRSRNTQSNTWFTFKLRNGIVHPSA